MFFIRVRLGHGKKPAYKLSVLGVIWKKELPVIEKYHSFRYCQDDGWVHAFDYP